MSSERDDYCVEHLRAALASDERVSELGLIVTVRDTRVFVSGAVSTPDRQRAVADVVHDLLPDCQVHNDTTVVSLGGVEVEQL